MGLFSSDKITKELLEKIASGVEAIAKTQEKQAIKLDSIEKAQKELSAKVEELDNRLSTLEDLTAKNFSNVIAQTELLLERLEFINRKYSSIENYLKILPRIKSLIDNMNEQIQLTPLKEIEFDNLSDSEKLLITMVKEIEKVTQKSSKELGNLIDKSTRDVVTAVRKKIDDKEAELHNGIVRNLKTLEGNLKLAIHNSRSRNSLSIDQIRRVVKEETRLPGSRNSYL